VTLGRLSHLTPELVREHFDVAARGTVAEGATVEASAGDGLGAGVVVTSVEVELA
jgi:Zn finger protein HypA/HybF involved in hydrogenase expression